MDYAGRLGSGVARVNRPGAAFVGAAGKEGGQAHKLVGLARQNVESRFLEADGVHEFLAVGFFLYVAKLGFKLSADYDDLASFVGRDFLYDFDVLVCSFGD